MFRLAAAAQLNINDTELAEFRHSHLISACSAAYALLFLYRIFSSLFRMTEYELFHSFCVFFSVFSPFAGLEVAPLSANENLIMLFLLRLFAAVAFHSVFFPLIFSSFFFFFFFFFFALFSSMVDTLISSHHILRVCGFEMLNLVVGIQHLCSV